MSEKNAGHKHNGRANYETWTVSLWLDCEEPCYRYWTEQARRWKGHEHAADRLAGQLRDELHEGVPLSEPTVYGDLLHAALFEVDWIAIAESFLGDIDDEWTEGGVSCDARPVAGPTSEREPRDRGPEEAEGLDA